MIILIPSYHPDERLLSLADDLRDLPGLRVLVVDDGSGPTFAHVFRSLEGRGVTVLRHPLNRGKGAALKTGFPPHRSLNRWQRAQRDAGDLCASLHRAHLRGKARIGLA